VKRLKKTTVSKKQTRMGIAAFILLVCILGTMFLSSAYIIIHAGHNHSHIAVDESCIVCAHVQTAVNLLAQTNTAGIPLVTVGVFISVTLSFVIFHFYSFQTLVTLKIKMNN